MKFLRIWLVLQIALMTLVLLFFPQFLLDIVTGIIYSLPYPHGFVKGFLESSQGILLRQNEIPFLLIFGAAFPVVLSFFTGRKWLFLTVIGCLLGGLSLSYYGLIGLICCLLLLVLSSLPQSIVNRYSRLLFFLAWIPAVGFFPVVLNIALQVKQKAFLRIWMAFCGAMIAFSWLWIDCLTHYKDVRYDMERWPQELLESGIKRIAQKQPCSECPPDVLCQYCSSDWHGLSLTKDHAIVVGEMIPRLIAFPLDGGSAIEYPLSRRDERRGLFPALEVELDESGKKIWVLDKGQELIELRFENGRFNKQSSQKIPISMGFAYLTRSDKYLLVTSVHTEGNSPRRIAILEQPSVRYVTNIDPLHNGQRIPMPRDALWVPSLQKLVLAPDFGTHLYLTDIESGDSVPWLETPTMNGKMIWLAQSGHIMLALPNRLETWRIDPVSKEIVQRIPTQPGVRTLAVDEERGRLVTASVLTGQIWIQDLNNGQVLKKLGTVMPMVRQMQLDEVRGVGVLTTWVDVYQFSYLDE